jgi:hypothetical protein
VHEGSFDRVIAEHLELQRRNSGLERSMPIARYRDSVEAERTDVALASRAAATEILDLDPPTETLVRPQAAPPWDDPDSWWNVDERSVGWAT